MTRRDELKEKIINAIGFAHSEGWGKDDEEIAELKQFVISALSQEPCEKCEVGNPCLYCKHEFSQKIEPCEDAISREDAIMAIEWGIECTTEEWKKDGRALCAKKIRELPSVTQKSGKWIKGKDEYGTNHFTCPFCGHDIATKAENWDDNYCSNCGARMEGVEYEKGYTL